MNQVAPISENSLALLRRYMTSHALFNGLSALQLCLLAQDAAAGLDLLRHHSGYLRALGAVSRCACCAAAEDEHRLLEHWTWLENKRHGEKSVLKYAGKPGTGRIPSFLLLPFLEFQSLRNAKGATLNAVLTNEKESGNTILHLSFSEPAREPAWNEEQRERRNLWLERMQSIHDAGICQINWQESDTEASITLNPLNDESCNCR